MKPDIRWKQRFENFSRGLALLREALRDGPAALSLLEKEGVIQRFEYTFELAWNTMKDFLQEQGAVVTLNTPRQILKDAFSANLLHDGQVWIDMLDHRNALSHNYDQAVIEAAVESIARRYLPAMDAFYRDLLVRNDL